MDLVCVVLIIFTAFLCHKLLSLCRAKPSDLPPCLRGLPVVGYYPFLTPNRYMAFTNLRDTYGDIFLVPLFTAQFLVLNSVKVIREALVTQGDVFSARPQYKHMTQIMSDSGIIWTDWPKWQEHRRFALRTLRDFGFAKSLSLQAVHQEVQTLIDVVEARRGQAIDTGRLFPRMTTNVIASITFGECLASKDAEYEKILTSLIDVIGLHGSMVENLPCYFPWMLHYPRLMRFYNRFARRERQMAAILAYIRRKVEEHEGSLRDDEEPRDFTDAILRHQLELDEQAGPNGHSFDTASIVGDLFDLFAAGTDTTAVTLSWACLLMAVHPEVQERVRQEVVEELSAERLATMQDRSKLNYTLAVVDEISRYASIGPTALLHKATSETRLAGYQVPKGTVVIANLFAVHRDPALWRRPDQFEPGNFLDENGAYKPSDNLIPFSVGRRACLGESLARMEVFVFFISILQRYRVSLHADDAQKLPALLMGSDGLVRHLSKHGILFTSVH